MSATSASAEAHKELIFPPVPATILRIRQEMASSSPDLHKITSLVSADVGLSAAVLKTINSPGFQRSRPVSSIPNAVMMLGMSKVLSIAVTSALRASFKGGGAWIEHFWEIAGDIATGMTVLARELSGVPDDKAYTFGLFHDSGIPLLMIRFPDYPSIYKAAVANPERSLIEIERECLGMSHAAVGAHVSHLWNLDPAITAAIRLHHDFETIFRSESGCDEEVVTLVGLLKMAEQASDEFRGAAARGGAGNAEWERIGGQVLSYFSLSPVQYRDISDTLVEVLSRR